MLPRICPQYQTAVVRAAELVCEHRIDLLGSGLRVLGTHIDWHIDFKTGHRWNPARYFAAIRPAPSPGGYDIKVPWELSRCQHFAWLGQAYWLTGDEKYTREFRSQIEDWIHQNPPQYGVNWACTMDVALRAVNWLWGYAFFRQSPFLGDEFHLMFYRSLLSHGRHIINNLEWSERLTSNHYLADIVGLVYLGFLLPEFREAERWRKVGLEELEKEMQKQVYPDGVGFEASTNYHRLSTELFLSATLLAELNGYTFRPEYIGRLERMIDVLRLIAHPDGTIPVMGDQDNGRVHRLKVWVPPEREWTDFRYLLGIGAAWKQNLTWAAAAGDQWEEAIWMLPQQTASIIDKLKTQVSETMPISTGLPDGGWYILQNHDFHVLVDLGSNGQNGNGGHAHNDSLSFDLFCQGQSWILDPGSYIYTQDYEARNLFRSTRMHNTVSLQGVEQNCFDPGDLFRIETDSVPQCIRWEVNNAYTLLHGRVQSNKSTGFIHERLFYLDNRENYLAIEDCVRGHPGPRQVVLHLPSEVQVKRLTESIPGFLLANPNHKCVWVLSIPSNADSISIGESWISRSYGSRQPCSTVVFEWDGERPHQIVIIPLEEGCCPKPSLLQGTFHLH